MQHEPAPANVIGSALQWLEGTLLGSVATAVAILAVASIGFLMLSGRIHHRRAGKIVLGCFIVFGASLIAAGIFGAAKDLGGNVDVTPIADQSAVQPPPPVYPQAPAQAYDPYAGAAFNPRQ